MKLWLIVLVTVGAMVFSTHPAGALPPQFHITIESGSPYFLPATATVVRGAGIRWDNPTPAYHTITYDGCMSGGQCLFDSGSIPPDGVYVLPGLPPGRYPYQCKLHPIMRGVLQVVDTGDFSALN